jgi:hypothetical protein
MSRIKGDGPNLPQAHGKMIMVHIAIQHRPRRAALFLFSNHMLQAKNGLRSSDGCKLLCHEKLLKKVQGFPGC